MEGEGVKSERDELRMEVYASREKSSVLASEDGNEGKGKKRKEACPRLLAATSALGLAYGLPPDSFLDKFTRATS